MQFYHFIQGRGGSPASSAQGDAASPCVYAMGYLLHALIGQVAALGNLIEPGLSDAMGYLLDSSSCGRCPLARNKEVAKDMSDSNGLLAGFASQQALTVFVIQVR